MVEKFYFENILILGFDKILKFAILKEMTTLLVKIFTSMKRRGK